MMDAQTRTPPHPDRSTLWQPALPLPDRRSSPAIQFRRKFPFFGRTRLRSCRGRVVSAAEGGAGDGGGSESFGGGGGTLVMAPSPVKFFFLLLASCVFGWVVFTWVALLLCLFFFFCVSRVGCFAGLNRGFRSVLIVWSVIWWVFVGCWYFDAVGNLEELSKLFFLIWDLSKNGVCCNLDIGVIRKIFLRHCFFILMCNPW